MCRVSFTFLISEFFAAFLKMEYFKILMSPSTQSGSFMLTELFWLLRFV